MNTDEDERINDLLIEKIDEITGCEMKKVGIQRMENELTIKKLDREYAEIKRNLIYSKKMLDEARKNSATQSETKSQLLHANKAIIEKFNELKKYQNEITLFNMFKVEKSLQDCMDRNSECIRILHLILDKDNYFDILNKNLLDKENQLNEDIQKQIDQKRETVRNDEETLSILTKKVEEQKIQIDGEKIDNRIKHAVEERNKRIIQLQANEDTLCKQFKQEIDDLQQKKFNKIQNLETHINDMKTLENNLMDLQSQFSETEKNVMLQNESLQNILIQIKDISSEIQKSHEINNQSNEFYENNFTSLHSEFALVNSELQREQLAFDEMENNMQDEMKKLFTQLEEKKNLQNTLEKRQSDLLTMKEKQTEQQKLLSQNCELDKKLANLTEEYEKQLSIASINTNKQIELNTKIKELREKRDNARKQLESLSKHKNQANKAMNNSSDSILNSAAENTMSSQQTTPQRKLYDTVHRTTQYNNSEIENNVVSSQTPKKTPQYLDNSNKSFKFNLDSSDESDDEFKTINKTPKKTHVSSTTPIYKTQDYTCGGNDKNTENPASENLSQSERLFDELIASQKPEESSTKKKDEACFIFNINIL
ncbi:paramyosin-like [Phymastichus coffea]|uniref:paramyosin-like n=1 Tax=Phymastichus coffea TaxID=108790 RepID=UPI00273B9434|nr:paramyosin-like [Phymastichus coffea]